MLMICDVSWKRLVKAQSRYSISLDATEICFSINFFFVSSEKKHWLLIEKKLFFHVFFSRRKKSSLFLTKSQHLKK